ncbi:PREDICTED: fas-associated death domain protein isoform X2 [Papilio polytes]|uniref:fas-associated death domain protein isoform X2 n=1 Tax=Papilio polytes TaxID=76194 RepID=UPI000676870D|nr:PREDICTED: fas-associated death domain protein isoform X2 [Papilio polytes]
MTLTNYSHLKQQIILSAGQSDKHSQILGVLKEYYKDEIDSPRRYENINTIGELMRVLEIRDILSEDNVMPLKEVASRLSNNRELLRKIDIYESTHVQRGFINQYVDQQHNHSTPKNETIETINSNPLGNMSKRKKERILETITEEIGIFWRDLARNLKIRECVIDEIDLNNRNLSIKAEKLLEAYEHKADPQRWFFVLCEALEKARRKDISRSLQDIMSMNI